ncbi:MAG: SufS family cysteine desulfurase, partial [Actinomycetota bacterium]
MLDVAAIREDFPILGRQARGKPLIYLDSAATSQKPRCVIEAEARFYAESNANVHRGIHALADEATELFEGARAKVARFIGAGSEREVIFTRGTTEAINLLAYAWARRELEPGDEVLITLMEHHSNLVPWQLACRDTGATLKYASVTEQGYLDLAEMESLISPRTRLVAVAWMSNVLGTINPVREIADAAHRAGALVVVDGAQAVPHIPVDVSALDADFLAFSGHKMCGPTGIGVLWGRQALLDGMEPFLAGGEMVTDVTMESATWSELPWKFEAGTPPIAQAIGLGAAIDYLESLGMEAIRDHGRRLIKVALGALGAVGGVRVLGPSDPLDRGPVASFIVEGVHAHDVAQVLDAEG